MQTKTYLTRQTKGITVTSDDPPHEDEYSTRGGRNHGPAWKLDVGAECNRLLQLAELLSNGLALEGYKATAGELARDLESIVERVAHFEELETEPT